MPRAVLLRHELPDGSFHYDWMVQRAGGPDRPLVAFRVAGRIDSGSVPAFVAASLGDHRSAYLDYEGPVSANRGRVERVVRGEMAIVEESADRLVVEGRLGNAAGRFEGSRVEGDRWQFRFATATR
jgi:hypothetical protein